MGYYRYKAKAITGELKKGILEANSKDELIKRLKEKDLYCFEVINQDTGISDNSTKKMKTKYLVSFCYKMSTLLQSGVSLSRALNILYDSEQNKKVKTAIIDLYEGVQKGKSMSDTMKDMDGMFPSLLVYMVEIGETSGTLDTIMSTMSTYYDGEQKLNNKLKAAMIYPIVLSIVSVVSVTFILTFVLPQFIGMFQGAEIPLPTRILLAISKFITEKWWLIILFILLCMLSWSYGMTNPAFKLKVHQSKLKIPVFGKLIRTVYTARFSTSFSILYKSGIAILTCIEITSKVLGNLYIQKKLEIVMNGLKQGKMLSEELLSVNVFDSLFSSMVLIGEEAGNLENSLLKAGLYFEKEADNAVMKMMALVEPLMIVILAIVIGFIVISIILPIFSMYNQIL